MSKIKGVAITMPERYFTEKGLSLPDNGSPLISRTALYAIRMQWLWEDSSVMGRPMPINGRSPPWLSLTPKAFALRQPKTHKCLAVNVVSYVSARQRL